MSASLCVPLSPTGCTKHCRTAAATHLGKQRPHPAFYIICTSSRHQSRHAPAWRSTGCFLWCSLPTPPLHDPPCLPVLHYLSHFPILWPDTHRCRCCEWRGQAPVASTQPRQRLWLCSPPTQHLPAALCCTNLKSSPRCDLLHTGVNVVSGGGKLQWPARNLGSICGDEPGQKKWISSGQVTGTYSSGSEITTDIVFAQNHLGRVFMSVCPLNAKSENECKALQR